MAGKITPTPRNGKIPFGVWIHGLQHAKNRGDMKQMVGRMVDQGVDILFPCIKQVTGEVDYPSTIAAQSPWSRERDVLAELLDVARDAKLKVHAWFCNFPEGKESRLIQGNPELRAIQKHPAKGLQSDNPDLWGESILWSCSNRPEVLDYQYSLMEEVIEKYPVAGVHFDWVRSGFYQCYCRYCQAKCRELTGADLLTEMNNFHPLAETWYGYRAANVTSLVKRVSAKAHARGMETSAAVFCAFPLSYNEQAQEWPLWLKEGYLDLAIPMTYTTIPAETHYFTIGHVAVGRDAKRGELWEGICCTDSRGKALEKGLMTRLTREAVEAGSPGLVVFSYPAMSDEIFAAIHQGMPAARKNQ
jgi:uncharacterized lipoprotein YddW (UPF0748 family)